MYTLADPSVSDGQPVEDGRGQSGSRAAGHQRQLAAVRSRPVQHQHRREPAQRIQRAAGRRHRPGSGLCNTQA